MRLDSPALAVGLLIGAGAGAAIHALLQRHPWRRRRVYVSGCFDLLHSGHGVHSNSIPAVLHSLHLDPVCSLLVPFLVAFFKEAAQYGELYVSVGNDANVTQLKAKPMFPEDERVYMVAAIRWVTHAYASGLRTHSPASTRDANLSFTTPRRFEVPLPQDSELESFSFRFLFEQLRCQRHGSRSGSGSRLRAAGHLLCE